VVSDNKGIAKRLIGFVEAAQQGHGETFAEIVAECVAALHDDERDALDFAIAKLRRFLIARRATSRSPRLHAPSAGTRGT